MRDDTRDLKLQFDESRMGFDCMMPVRERAMREAMPLVDIFMLHVPARRDAQPWRDGWICHSGE
jgi:hypothetical protein